MNLNNLLSLRFANEQRLSTEGNTWTVSIQQWGNRTESGRFVSEKQNKSAGQRNRHDVWRLNI